MANGHALRAYASRHLEYDVLMMRRTQELLAIPLSLPENRFWPMRNALLESFAVHTRVLMEFFYEPVGKGKEANDARARLYCPNGTWTESMPNALEVVRAKDRVGTEIVHASLQRLDVTEQAKYWKHQQIRAVLERTLAKFLRMVDPRDLIDERTRTLLAPDPLQAEFYSEVRETAPGSRTFTETMRVTMAAAEATSSLGLSQPITWSKSVDFPNRIGE